MLISEVYWDISEFTPGIFYIFSTFRNKFVGTHFCFYKDSVLWFSLKNILKSLFF